MHDLDRLIDTINVAAATEGLPALARRSGVPYTTLIDWQRAGWKPKAVRTLERLAIAVSAANDDTAASEAA